MNLLIVDDEFYLVQGVKNSLDWSQYGIDQVFEAYSADQARKIYEENEVDILLSDVEMPKENGLSLIQWAKDNGYESVNILLTGHANFDYAKEGIRLQILDYILKPIEEDALSRVIQKASDQVRENQEKTEIQKAEALSDMWLSLYEGQLAADPDSVAEYISANNLPEDMLDTTYFYAYLQIKSAEPFTYISEITSFLHGIISKSVNLTQVEGSSYMISIPSELSKSSNVSAEEFYFAAFSRALDKLNENYNDKRFIFYLFSEAPLIAAPYAYELLQQYSKTILSTASRVISILNPDLAHITEKTRESSQNIPLAKWEELLSQGRSKDILLDIRGLLMQTDTTFSSNLLRSVYYGLLSISFTVLTQNNCSPVQITEEMSHTMDPGSITSSGEGLIKWAESLLRSVETLLNSSENESSVIDQVKQYIRNNISDPDLGRATIAESVHISPDYLSFVFHKEEGKVLSSYITEERIAAAKKLLLNSNASSQEIAEKTGFSGVSYFHKQFKKVTGITPNAYRNGQS